MLISCLFVDFIYFQPIIVYMVIKEEKLSFKEVVFLVPLLFHIQTIPIYVSLCIVVSMLAAIFLKLQYLKSEHIKQAYKKQRDATQELAYVLTAKNQNLMIQQEQEIRIATLDERNRIAREIHDNVGHLLSSALLQIGALQVMIKEEHSKNVLVNLRDIIQKLLDHFTFCEVDFEYDVIHPLKQDVIYHVAAILKECLNNTMKHSNATKVSIVIREQPAFYQLIMEDNGTKKSIPNDGIGLHNIKDRVDSLNGYVNITMADGFRVFITLPKEETICEC